MTRLEASHGLAWSRPLARAPARRRLAPLLVSGFLGLCVLGSAQGAHVAFREDELLCEEAVARLKECCTDAELLGVDCVHNPGCQTSAPTISPEESECIRSRSCAQLRRQSTCDALLARSDGNAEPEICQ